MPERLVLCGGAKRSGGDSTLRLALSGRAQNITLKLFEHHRPARMCAFRAKAKSDFSRPNFGSAGWEEDQRSFRC